MTSCVRILSASTIDSSPSILIVSNDTSNSSGKHKKNMITKILINCGEGCQRTFVEYSQKLSTITTICLCSHQNEMIGGLPGAIMTIADSTATNVITSAPKETAAARTTNHNTLNKNMDPTKQESSSVAAVAPPLYIIGPKGIKQYISSLRHFMRRDAFSYVVQEVMIENSPGDHQPALLPVTATTSSSITSSSTPQDSKRKKPENHTDHQKIDAKSNETSGFTIESIAFSDHDQMTSPWTAPIHLKAATRKRLLDDVLETSNGTEVVGSASTIASLDMNNNNDNGAPRSFSSTPASSSGVSYVSYILRTSPVPGKFLIEKALALGIPKGPLYQQLKKGQNISFMDARTNEQRNVSSSDVVEPSTPPIVIMILCYPTVNVAKQLFSSKHLQHCDESETMTAKPELVIHITSSSLFHQYGICHWKQDFDNNMDDGNICSGTKRVDHIFLPLPDLKHLTDSDIAANPSPFRSAMLDAYARSLIHPGIYVCPNNQFNDVTINGPVSGSGDANEFHIGRPTMEYTLLPRSKRGFAPVMVANELNDQRPAPITTDIESMDGLVEHSGALTLAQQIIKERTPDDTRRSGGGGEIIFTGTASALPCKHRNVTGMLLKQSDQRSIILDIGEGTIGQLMRMRSSSEDRRQQSLSIYNEVKAVWISHPHADHHLGLMRLLKDRRPFETEKLLVIAPTPIFRFLDEMSLIDNDLNDTYIAIDCKDLVGESPEFLPHQQTIHDILGTTRCRAVPVAHCAHAYAVIFDGTSFGRVVYSGDCRPSTQLAIIAKGADVLIHESTFESDMQADAVLKKHSTIDEALNIGRLMECKCIVLTHFSQRYSKIPPLPSQSEDDYPFPIIYAYDFMKLQPHTLFVASKLTPALRLLFADDLADSSNDETNLPDPIESSSNGAHVLSIPGAFANASLL